MIQVDSQARKQIEQREKGERALYCEREDGFSGQWRGDTRVGKENVTNASTGKSLTCKANRNTTSLRESFPREPSRPSLRERREGEGWGCACSQGERNRLNGKKNVHGTWWIYWKNALEKDYAGKVNAWGEWRGN